MPRITSCILKSRTLPTLVQLLLFGAWIFPIHKECFSFVFVSPPITKIKSKETFSWRSLCDDVNRKKCPIKYTSTSVIRIPSTRRSYPDRCCFLFFSSYYEDFEEFENGDDEDDDEEDYEEEEDEEEYEKLDQRSIADFKNKMSNMFDSETAGTATTTSVDDLINFARQQRQLQQGDGGIETTEWAIPAKDAIQPGTVLVANPKRFCESTDENENGGEDKLNLFRIALGGDGSSSRSPSPSLLAKFGLTRPPPKRLGPDRQADLLPVVVIVEVDRNGVNGVLLNRRTGYLLGDLEQPPPNSDTTTDSNNNNITPILQKFCIQPLWFGGVDNISTGLDMLHLCPTVPDCKQITEDGLFWGGDPAQAQDAMDDPSLDRIYSGFDFKFFVQSTIWSTNALRKEIEDDVWFPAQVSKIVLFKSRDRMGTKKAKPLWTEIMELLGGHYAELKDKFYSDGERYSIEQDDDIMS